MSIQDDYRIYTEAIQAAALDMARALDSGPADSQEFHDAHIRYVRFNGWLQCYHKAALTPHPATLIDRWLTALCNIEGIMNMDKVEHEGIRTIISNLMVEMTTEYNATVEGSP